MIFIMASRIDGIGTRQDSLTAARRLKTRKGSKRENGAVIATPGRLGCPTMKASAALEERT